MGHPYEIAELVQEYTNDNLDQLTNALVETRGVFAPGSDELKAEVAPTDVDEGVRITIRPGFAICGKGILHVQNEVSVTINAKRLANDNEVYLWEDGQWSGPKFSGSTVYLNLKYREEADTPVDIMPYGSGEADLRIVPSFKLVVEDSAIDIADGVSLAKATGQQLLDKTVEDTRDTNVAKLRADRSLLYDLVDPALVGDVEALFSRENFVEDIKALLDEEKLNGDDVVTQPKDAVDPFFVRTRYETSVRSKLRDLNAIDVEVDLEPDPEWEAQVEWNLYGIKAAYGGTSDEFNIYTEYDLTQIDYQGYDLPLYLRYGGELHEIAEIIDGSTVRTASDVTSGPQTDLNAAITNGADEFHVDAEPGIHWFRKNKRSKDFAVDSEVREPVAKLTLDPGFWNVIIQSRGQNSQSSKTIGVEIPNLTRPGSPKQISVTGEQRTPATEDPNEDRKPANPFNEIDLGPEGEPIIDQQKLDRYVKAIREELKRIQKQEVALHIDITPQARTREESKRAMVVGYNVEVEMLTGDGWKTEREMEIHRSTEGLMRELTWIDLMSDRYRGSVGSRSDLTNLSNNMSRLDVETDSNRPVKEDEIVHVEGNNNSDYEGYWRYEPKMRQDQADGLTAEDGSAIETYPYSSNDEGYWVQIDVQKGAFQAETVSRTITGVKGGADYRITVEPIGEDGRMGEEMTDTTDELRDKYNAELGFDFHSAINDIYSAYKRIAEETSPEQFNEYLNNRMEEIRGLIDRAALYGTPPETTGPFQVSPQPGVVRFSGRNLGSIQKVFMRYAPPGRTAEEQVVREARFKVLIGQGEPQVAVMNMPDRSQLSRRAAPVVTFEFNAGARGSDFFTVRYRQKKPAVVSPSVAQFKEERIVNIKESTTYQNTASVWRYDSRGGADEEPTVYGPVPKIWPGDRSWDARSGIFDQYWETSGGELVNQPEWDPNASYSSGDIVYYSPTDKYYIAGASIGQGVVPSEDGNDWSVHTDKERPVNESATVKGLQFQTKRFNPSDILDIRIRSLPSEKLVPQIAYVGERRWENKVSSPYYYAFQMRNNLAEILVPSSGQRYWIDQNFSIEYIYYPTPLQGGGLHDGKGVILRDKGTYNSSDGWSSDTPSNPAIGHYYEDEEAGTYWIYDDLTSDGTENPTWHQAEHIEFARHTFSIQRNENDQIRQKETEVRFLSRPDDTANAPVLNEDTPRIGFDTPDESGKVEPPFTRRLADGADLGLNAPMKPTIDGTTFVFDEFHYRAGDVDKNRSSLPENTKALAGNREVSDFGNAVISSATVVEGASVQRIVILSQYKEIQTIETTVDTVMTDGDKSAVLVNVDSIDGTGVSNISGISASDQFLVEAGDVINASSGQSISISGIVTSFEEEWRGNGPYPVLRATSFSVGPADEMKITGPDVEVLEYLDGNGSLDLDYVVNREIDTSQSNHSYNVYWASGSDTLSSLSSSLSVGTGQSTINVTLDWEDIWGSRDKILRELRPVDESIGDDHYDGPLYREEEIFDFRKPNLNVLSLRLKVEAEYEGQVRTKYVAIQLAPDYVA